MAFRDEVTEFIKNHQNSSPEQNMKAIEFMSASEQGKSYFLANPNHHIQLQQIYNQAIESVSNDLLRRNQAIFAAYTNEDFATLKTDVEAKAKAKEAGTNYTQDISAFAAQIDLHNEINERVKNELAGEPSPSMRVIIIERWVAVLQNTFEKGDYSSSIAIFSALKSKLLDDKQAQVVKDSLSPEANEILATFSNVFGNATSQYASMSNRSTPFIPFIPAYLAMINFNEDTGNTQTNTHIMTELNKQRDAAQQQLANKAEQTAYIVMQISPDVTMTNKTILPTVAREIELVTEKRNARSIKETSEFVMMADKKIDKAQKEIEQQHERLKQAKSVLSVTSQSSRALAVNYIAIDALLKAHKNNQISTNEVKNGLDKIIKNIENNRKTNLVTNIRSRIQTILGGKENDFLKAAKNLQVGFATLGKFEIEKQRHQVTLQKLGAKIVLPATAKNSATVDIYKLLSPTKNKTELADQIEHNQIQQTAEREKNKEAPKQISHPVSEPTKQNTTIDLDSTNYSAFKPR